MTPASVTDALSKYHRQWVQWGNGIGTHACLLNLVGFNKTVLEIGCNTGYLSSVMQQRGCQVTGVEIDPNAAESARSFCRRVIVGDAEKLDWRPSWATNGLTSSLLVMCWSTCAHPRPCCDNCVTI